MLDATDCKLMSTFELIDRINCTNSWADNDVDEVIKELCDRYNIDFNAYDNYEDVWDQIIKAVYNDVVVHHQYTINNHDYTIVSLESDTYSEFAVIDDGYEKIMFDVYEIGTMKECKKYIKELIDNA